MKKRKWNISILVIFVLIASSLIGVLTMNFINQMLYTSNNILSYYKSYYIAHGWLELLLTASKNRGMGWEYSIGTGNSWFMQENFACEHCDFSAHLYSTTPTLSKEFWKSTWCLSPLTLAKGESLFIPLIKDISAWSISDAFIQPVIYQNISQSLEKLSVDFVSWWVSNDVVVWLLILSGSDLYTDGVFFRTGSLTNPGLFIEFKSAFENTINIPRQTATLKNYLIIANTQQDTPMAFCINSPSISLPTDTLYITSNGSYGDQTIGLELVYKQVIPSFLMNTDFGF